MVSFYPTILKELLSKAITFAKQYTNIKDDVVHTMMHSRKSLLFSNGDTWIKQENPNFDVAMGVYDGAEICELVGL